MKIEKLYVAACTALMALLALPLAAADSHDSDGGGVGPFLIFAFFILFALTIVILFAVIRQVNAYEIGGRLRLGK